MRNKKWQIIDYDYSDMAYSKAQLIEANLLLLQRYEGLLKGKRFNIQEFKRKFTTYSKNKSIQGY